MATIFDEVPYTNLPFTQTRPAALATVAALHGLTYSDPREARVLELGCGGGVDLELGGSGSGGKKKAPAKRG